MQINRKTNKFVFIFNLKKLEKKAKNTLETEVVNQTEQIAVYGARVHNLQNIDVIIPRNQLTVITGLSGSGKSSLAFDTIYAEGQRRYIETFSAYARQFLGGMERPDVDLITGLSPVISIEQKTTGTNPRSTVGTVTEIYDYLRLLYARVGDAYSYVSGEKMVQYTDEQIIELILEQFINQSVIVLAPLVRGRKGHYKELFENVARKGFLNVRIDGKMQEITKGMKLDRYKVHDIEIQIDKVNVNQDSVKRLREAIDLAMKHGENICLLLDPKTNKSRFFSRQLMCPTSGISYEKPSPHNFSFNSPKGACPKCRGLGTIDVADLNKIIPDGKKNIHDGTILPLGSYVNNFIFWQLESVLKKHDFSLRTPWEELTDECISEILYGSGETMQVSPDKTMNFNSLTFNGVLAYIVESSFNETTSKRESRMEHYLNTQNCPECKGYRLRQESLYFKLNEKHIGELGSMDIDILHQWLSDLENNITNKQQSIAKEIIKELLTRLSFLLEVGLNYLTINRPSSSLSGGESQRIRLATQIGSQLVNVLYILDEPSIGLHPRDNVKLINSLNQLRDIGNTILVVEHDKEMMLAADFLVDMGPLAGKHGGKVVAAGTPQEVLKHSSLTADYINGIRKIEVPKERRKGNGKYLEILGATGHNLKNVSVKFPLGCFICVTGVSGSGKSSLINQTIHPIISHKFYRSLREPLPYKDFLGIENIDKVIEVDQSPIGRTPRSNPATYCGLFDDIRKLYEVMPESKIRGYKSGRFSFNVKGGRCEECRGAGLKTIEMNFLPDVYVECESCSGKRYNRETLEVRYKGKSISDILNMTIEQAVDFFSGIPSLANKIAMLNEVGLGYITLGQPSTTLSGGESQRVKLAAELSKKQTGKTLYILDEPTTGLHFEDVRVLMEVLNRLVDKGNTVIVIEHNLDVVKVADYIIDIGPDGGRNGGELIFAGTPEDLIKNKRSFTAKFLKDELK